MNTPSGSGVLTLLLYFRKRVVSGLREARLAFSVPMTAATAAAARRISRRVIRNEEAISEAVALPSFTFFGDLRALLGMCVS